MRSERQRLAGEDFEKDERLLVASAGSGALIDGMKRCTATPSTRRVRALVVGLALLSTACTSSNAGDDERSALPTGATATTATTLPAPTSTLTVTSTTVRSTPTTGGPVSAADLTAAVRAFWDTYLEIGASTDPFDRAATRARLAERSTGASLERLVTYFESNTSSGYLVRGGIDIAPTVVSASGDTAQIRDCYDDTTGLYRSSDGTRVDADNPLRHQVLMTLVRDAGTWKVAAIADEGDGCTVAR